MPSRRHLSSRAYSESNAVHSLSRMRDDPDRIARTETKTRLTDTDAPTSRVCREVAAWTFPGLIAVERKRSLPPSTEPEREEKDRLHPTPRVCLQYDPSATETWKGNAPVSNCAEGHLRRTGPFISVVQSFHEPELAVSAHEKCRTRTVCTVG